MIATAKVFKTGGSQAVRLPKAFRFSTSEVTIERKGDAVVLREKKKRKPKFKTLNELAAYLDEKYPGCTDFPEIERPKAHDRPILEF